MPCVRQLFTKKLRHVNSFGEEEICFSKDPIHTCKGPCRRPDQYLRQHVSFACLPRFEAETQRLVAESLARPVELPDVFSNLEEEVAIPLYCDAL